MGGQSTQTKESKEKEQQTKRHIQNVFRLVKKGGEKDKGHLERGQHGSHFKV